MPLTQPELCEHMVKSMKDVRSRLRRLEVLVYVCIVVNLPKLVGAAAPLVAMLWR